jgi:hypothetical protein
MHVLNQAEENPYSKTRHFELPVIKWALLTAKFVQAKQKEMVSKTQRIKQTLSKEYLSLIPC